MWEKKEVTIITGRGWMSRCIFYRIKQIICFLGNKAVDTLGDISSKPAIDTLKYKTPKTQVSYKYFKVKKFPHKILLGITLSFKQLFWNEFSRIVQTLRYWVASGGTYSDGQSNWQVLAAVLSADILLVLDHGTAQPDPVVQSPLYW